MWAIGDWRTVGLFVSIASVMSISWCANGSWAQESGAGAVDSVQREKQLRDQMQTILNELEELQKAKPATPAAEIPAAPVVKERETTAQVQEDGKGARRWSMSWPISASSVNGCSDVLKVFPFPRRSRRKPIPSRPEP